MKLCDGNVSGPTKKWSGFEYYYIGITGSLLLQDPNYLNIQV